MIDDIIFGGTASGDTTEFILETPQTVNGSIISYSLDGPNYDFTSAGGESITIIIS